MKRVLLCMAAAALCLYNPAKAQSYCMSFDSCSIGDAYTRDHAFAVLGNGNPGCLSDWEVTNGTPSIWRNTDGQGNAYDGTQMILEGVSGDQVNSEGVALKYNFMAGQAYTVSLARRNSTSGAYLNVNYILLDSAISYTYNFSVGGSPTPAIPVGAYIAYTDSNLGTAPWQLINFTTPVLSKNYTRLWFRVDYPLTQSTAYLLLDSICIQPVQQAVEEYCVNFDSCSITDAYTRDHAFAVLGNGNPGCLSDWEVTNGTPSIWRNTDGQGNAYDGTQMILEGVSGDQVNSEGVALKYGFMAGQAYTIIVARRNSTSSTHINVNYILLDSAINYTYNFSIGGSPTPAIPAGALTVYTDSNLATAAWQRISFNTPVLSKNYTRLWFRADYPLSQQTAYLLLDDICVHAATVGITELAEANDAQPQLFQNTGNPFSDETTIGYHLPQSFAQHGFIQVYDVTGKLIQSFAIAANDKGTVMLNAGNMQSGIYLYSMVVNGQRIDTRRMIVAR